MKTIPLEPPPLLRAADLKNALGDLQLRQLELATVLGVTEATVSRWCKGKSAVPEPISAYVYLYGLAVAADIRFEKTGRPRLSRPPRRGSADRLDATKFAGFRPLHTRS
jgi:transcriptional regulator with XRE-family HTH domain